MANMKSRKKPTRKSLTEEEIDRIVTLQADDDSAWAKPIQVRRAESASLSIPAELSARAAFLAKLHRERNLEDWLRKVIKERVELEEVAFPQAKREMSLRKALKKRGRNDRPAISYRTFQTRRHPNRRRSAARDLPHRRSASGAARRSWGLVTRATRHAVSTGWMDRSTTRASRAR